MGLTKYILIPILLATTSFCEVCAHVKDSIVVTHKAEYDEFLIHFRGNKSTVDSSYMNNAQELSRLQSTYLRIFSDASCSIDSVLVYVSSSPEGNFYTNRWLMRARTQSLQDYLYSRFPHLQTERVIIKSDPENWSGLRQLVVEDSQMPRQKETLNLLDTAEPKSKKSKLKALGGGAVYTYIVRNFSRHLRYGSIRTTWYSTQSDTVQISTPIERDVVSSKSMDSVELELPLVPSMKPDIKPEIKSDIKPDTTAGITSASRNLVTSNTYHDSLPRFALKTNLLYLAALCLNVEGEYYFANRWSVNLEYQYAWWSNKTNHKYYRLAAVSPEVRYWFASKRNFKGHFAGIYVGAGMYEFMAKPTSGIQGEFFIAGGVSYGYAFPVTKRMNMELLVGVGYMMTEYRKYFHDVDCYVYSETKKFTYFGPTKAKVSLVFPLQFKKGKRY